MTAYGLGVLPGTSLIDAADVIISETGQLPHIPQLPARGISSDAVGRTAALLESVSVDRGPRSWILTDRPQLLTRRVEDQLSRDLDGCEEAWGTTLETVKVQVTGPWTLAGSIELANGHRVLTDGGALRDLTDALIEGIRTHVADVHRRFGAEVIVQLDEPLLPIVNAGMPGASDFHPVRPVHAKDLAELLSRVVGGVPGPVYLNQTGYAPLWSVARESGVETVQVTVDQVSGTTQLDSLGQAISSGLRVGLGITTPRATEREVMGQIARLWDELGLDPALLDTQVDIHPRGGFPTGSLLDAARAYRLAATIRPAEALS